MIVSTWNVNGLRSASASGFASWLSRESPDIVCLQETKMAPDMLTENWFNGYRLEIFPAKKPGYAGTAILCRDSLGLVQFTHGIGNEEFDLEGRVISAEFDSLEVICIYAPHSHRELKNLEKKVRFGNALNAFIARRIDRADRKPIVLAGDLNVAFEEKDVFHFANNRGNAGFHPLERTWFSKILDLGFIDALRAVTADGGIFSWWSLLPGVREKNVGWRLDYILVDKKLETAIENCFHSVEATGSDHCPVSVVLSGFDLKSG